MDEDEGFYTRERWENWMDRIADEEFDPDDEGSARLFFNLQDDVTIACVNAVEAFDEGEIDEDDFFEEMAGIRDVVMDDVDLGDADKEIMLEGVQTSLIGVLASCETYVTNGARDDAEVEEFVREAVETEDDDVDRALALVSEAGAKVIDGEGFDAEAVEGDVDYGFVTEWINGLDSLDDAVSEPETIEEES